MQPIELLPGSTFQIQENLLVKTRENVDDLGKVGGIYFFFICLPFCSLNFVIVGY